MSTGAVLSPAMDEQFLEDLGARRSLMLPTAQQNGSGAQEKQVGFLKARDTRSPSQQLLLRVLVEGPDGPQSRVTLPVSGMETIRELKMVLSKKSWFTSKHCLFFGDRELLDHQQVAQVVHRVHQGGNKNYLHVFVRAQDVRVGKLSTDRASLSFGNLAALDDAPSSPVAHTPRTSSARPFGNGTLHTVTTSSSELSTVLHIVIRKSAHVSWSTARTGEFELTVRTTDTPSKLKEQLLPGSGSEYPALIEDLEIYHNGVRLQADRPLLEYGLHDGDVLELVPFEPTIPPSHNLHSVDSKAGIFPALSSPTHELYVNWQRAATGLKAGAVHRVNGSSPRTL
jgi:hypothetical protein